MLRVPSEPYKKILIISPTGENNKNYRRKIMKKHQSLLLLLKIGEENAIPLRLASEVYGVSTKDFKSEVQEARNDGILICSSWKGYFLPKTKKELQTFYDRSHKIYSVRYRMLKPTETFLKESSKNYIQSQLDIRGNKRAINLGRQTKKESSNKEQQNVSSLLLYPTRQGG